MDAQIVLQDMWRNLRNDFSERARGFVLGAITALYLADVISDEQRELWTLRIDDCPGHGDEGGRVWCAYCGNLDLDEKE